VVALGVSVFHGADALAELATAIANEMRRQLETGMNGHTGNAWNRSIRRKTSWSALSNR